MKVEMTTSNAEEANKIVSAVVDAYKSEVVDSEMEKHRNRVNELEQIYTNNEQLVHNSATILSNWPNNWERLKRKTST